MSDPMAPNAVSTSGGPPCSGGKSSCEVAERDPALRSKLALRQVACLEVGDALCPALPFLVGHQFPRDRTRRITPSSYARQPGFAGRLRRFYDFALWSRCSSRGLWIATPDA
jgi:hypothetical protein